MGSSGAPLLFYRYRGPPVTSDARTGRPRRRLLAAVLVALLAAAAVVGARAFSSRRAGDRAADPKLSAEVRAVIPQLEAFVEGARDLKFVSPVKVLVLGDAAFKRKVDEGNTGPADADAVETGFLRALGLVGAKDKVSSGDVLEPDDVDGYYDSDTKELVVRGTRPTPFVRQVLVHELTHALDDQHFGIDPDLQDDEAVLAYDALVEGDATSVEYRYVDSLSAAEQQQASDEENAGAPADSKDYDPISDLADFPYVDGPDFIDALVAAGGQARVDEAFRHPPTTSAEILHPDRFLAGRGRAPVPDVAADGRDLDDGVVGEYLLGLVLGETVPQDRAERAVAGWTGDEYVEWRSGRRYCVRTTVVLDSPADAADFSGALRDWAADHAGATVGGGAAGAPAATDVTFTRCA